MTDFYAIGRSMYLLGIAELAVYNFYKGDFAMTRPGPLPESLQGVNPEMAYISGALLLIAVTLSFLNKYRSASLLTIAGLVFLLATSRHISHLWSDHINGFKSLWLIGGSLLILTSSYGYRQHQAKATWFNVVVLLLFFVACGIAHFRFPDFVRTLIPDFIPFSLFFTYFAGICLILGGLGLVIPFIRRHAALLSGIQITGWFFLLHIPRAITIKGDEWIGVGESLAVAGICFMLYKNLTGTPAVTELADRPPG